jgi:protein TonB
MFEPLPHALPIRTRSLASAALHAALLAILIFHPHSRPIRVLMPGTARGSHIDLVYSPGSVPHPINTHESAKASAPPHPRRLKKLQPLPAEQAALTAPEQPTPGSSQHDSDPHAPPSSSPNATSGSDALGSGNIQIALTVYSPSPRPDLSRLPRGSQGEVVLDVTIDKTGKVSEVALLHPLGYGVDESVLGTVRGWVFHPATENGIPVDSVQELHFHYGPV